MTAVIAYAGRRRSLTLAWGAGRPVPDTSQVAIPATVVAMSPRPDGKLTTTERAARANAALTTEQRSAAGRARAATLHHPVTLARRIAAKWPELSDEDRRAVRRELRAAGVIA